MNTTRSNITVNNSLSYVYDNLYRLTQATNPLPSTPDESFSYDTVGNRLAKQGQVIQSVYNDANRLLENERFIYQYDNNGNLVQKTNKSSSEIIQYSYDAENQLIQVSKSGMTASYRYDGSGRRIEKDVNGTVTRYIYDQTDLIMEYDGSNTLIASYTFGSFVDEPLIMYRGGQSYYYHNDKLGSIMEITDVTGVVVKSYAYDSYGNIVLEMGTLENPFTYTGREFDSETGLYYYRARYYDSSIGRFINEDPVGFGAGDINIYNYVQNRPLDFTDPYGLKKVGGCTKHGYKPVAGMGDVCAPDDPSPLDFLFEPKCGIDTGCGQSLRDCWQNCLATFYPFELVLVTAGSTTAGGLGRFIKPVFPTCGGALLKGTTPVNRALALYGAGLVITCGLACDCDPCSY